MAIEKIDFPGGLSPIDTNVFIASVIAYGSREATERLVPLDGAYTPLPIGIYDVTPEKLKERRYLYQLVVTGEDSGVLTKILNPNRRHTRADRLRDYFRALRRPTSPVVATTYIPPETLIQIPSQQERYFSYVLHEDRDPKTYTIIVRGKDNPQTQAALSSVDMSIEL